MNDEFKLWACVAIIVGLALAFMGWASEQPWCGSAEYCKAARPCLTEQCRRAQERLDRIPATDP